MESSISVCTCITLSCNKDHSKLNERSDSTRKGLFASFAYNVSRRYSGVIKVGDRW